MKTRTLTFTLSIFLCVAAHAELKWEQNTIDLHPGVGDKTAVAHFKYQNTGTTPVRFKSVKASCGCTTTQSQKEVVSPGEKGEIVATFNIGDRTGQQMKTVTVQTDDPNPTQATTVLTLKANIAQALEIKPSFVYWQSGEEPKPKKISIKASKDFPAKDITVKSNSPNFESKVEPGKTSGEWTIEVTPKDTSHPMGTALVVQTDYPKEAPKSFNVNAQINNPPGAPPALKPNVPNAPAIKTATPAAIPSASPAGGVER
ncbi:MAG TPA: DUF1573 domain-containing protein [Chthoniobacterales bacterium]|nr:DUF1573 domain-containing protein [Chthoniobacterales bacterium]